MLMQYNLLNWCVSAGWVKTFCNHCREQHYWISPALCTVATWIKIVLPGSSGMLEWKTLPREEFRPIDCVWFPPQSVFWSGSKRPVFGFLFCPWSDLTDSGILCFLHRSLFESPKVNMALTKVEVFPLLLTLQLILPLVSGSALGISISLCDPGPCAPTAVCQVLDNFKDLGQSVNNKIWDPQPPKFLYWAPTTCLESGSDMFKSRKYGMLKEFWA